MVLGSTSFVRCSRKLNDALAALGDGRRFVYERAEVALAESVWRMPSRSDLSTGSSGWRKRESSISVTAARHTKGVLAAGRPNLLPEDGVYERRKTHIH